MKEEKRRENAGMDSEAESFKSKSKDMKSMVSTIGTCVKISRRFGVEEGT